MTSAEFKQARKDLGLTAKALSAVLGLGVHGSRTVQRIEAGGVVTGPMSLAMQKLLDDLPRR